MFKVLKHWFICTCCGRLYLNSHRAKSVPESWLSSVEMWLSFASWLSFVQQWSARPQQITKISGFTRAAMWSSVDFFRSIWRRTGAPVHTFARRLWYGPKLWHKQSTKSTRITPSCPISHWVLTLGIHAATSKRASKPQPISCTAITCCLVLTFDLRITALQASTVRTRHDHQSSLSLVVRILGFQWMLPKCFSWTIFRKLVMERRAPSFRTPSLLHSFGQFHRIYISPKPWRILSYIITGLALRSSV